MFAHEFCLEGNYYRAGDAVNFAIGQGDTLVTPLQLARAYAALSNGGTLYEPRVAKAIVSPDGKVIRRIPPKVQGHVQGRRRARCGYVDHALLGTRQGRHAWPGRSSASRSTRCTSASKTGSAEVYGKQIDLVGRVLRQELRRGDDGHPGRHRLGHLRARRCARSGRRSTASTARRSTPQQAR